MGGLHRLEKGELKVLFFDRERGIGFLGEDCL